jgi:hypothetical protein
MHIQRPIIIFSAVVLLLLMSGCVGFGMALQARVIAAFELPLSFDNQHMLLIHNGPNAPHCSFLARNVDCTIRVPSEYAFSIHYMTPASNRVLLSIRLPKPRSSP